MTTPTYDTPISGKKIQIFFMTTMKHLLEEKARKPGVRKKKCRNIQEHADDPKWRRR